MNRFAALVASSLVLGAAACGGGSSAGEPLSTEEAARVCEDTCAHLVECGWGDPDQLSCESDCHEFAEPVRSDFMLDLADCINALECSEDASRIGECVDSTVAALDLRAPHDEFMDLCLERTDCCFDVEQCEEAVDEIVVYSDDVVDGINACLDLACGDEMESCFEAALPDL